MTATLRARIRAGDTFAFGEFFAEYAPDALLAMIYAGVDGQQRGPAEAFDAIGDLLRESMYSAAVKVALHRAAAKIPGAELVPDSADAIGRHGVAVARVAGDERDEWIFDTGGSCLVWDTVRGKAGMITSTTAVTERAAVDRLGTRPCAPRGRVAVVPPAAPATPGGEAAPATPGGEAAPGTPGGEAAAGMPGGEGAAGRRCLVVPAPARAERE
ncbi:hypothetical protein [Actinoplanes sp. N902-109]|uniref:hypothetical protein n=1 Tax=Actinoplanes sp. (strain N902-109) TaxID=649831 RepID=UPI0003295628|nr:hypothetical protein [Actinoplanes sp. N902-109]AGL15881.1 hypothetical protein L083_2371 [Actinoplanes sp. N902-109]